MLSAGLVACSPAPTQAPPLKCTATPGSAAPAQNTVETITAATRAGARVTTLAHYKSKTTRIDTVSDSAGHARALYDVGTATVGYPVLVTVSVADGSQTATCATSFTPTKAVTPPKTGLRTATAVSWLGVGDATKPLPDSSGAGSCFYTHVRTGGGCGTVVVSALVSGFGAYGGTPACPTSGSCNPDPFNGKEASLSGQLQLNWLLKCTSTGALTPGSSVVALGPAWMSSTQYVSRATRINNDSAQLQIAADLPLGSSIAACSGPSTVASIEASAVSLHLTGGGYPDATFNSPGPFVH